MSVFSDINANISTLSFLTVTEKRKLHAASFITLGDLLSNIPIDYEERNQICPISHAFIEKKSLVHAKVVQHNYIQLKRKGTLLEIEIQDDSGVAFLHCYGREFLRQVLSIEQSVYIWGNFSMQYGKITASSFEVISNLSAISNRLGIVPRYRVPTGFSQITYSKMIKKTLQNISVEELHSYNTEVFSSPMSRLHAIQTIHNPKTIDELTLAQEQFAFDEILLFQLYLASLSRTQNISKKEVRKNVNNYSKTILSTLPFSLTRGQSESLARLQGHLLSDCPMNTLLQGDVGSGKTLIAVFCALLILENKEQVAFAVPSESLAHQHFDRISTLLQSIPITCALLTGSTSTKERKDIVEGLKNSSIHFVIGTHALYSADVSYCNLGFIIIDEQHRFGVEQRSHLIQKGIRENFSPDVLLMSATPIPRSLALTVYGTMTIESLYDRPAIQQTVKTRLLNYENRTQAYGKIVTLLEKGEQAFFIFPQIDISRNESRNVLSVEALFPEISTALQPYKCAALHSKILDNEKVEIMQQFSQGLIQVLVATTIIEVGIDIPNATSIVIFNAERFGLATLHQLRGRVGRGSLPGEAILIYTEPLQETAKLRLKTIYEEIDGFKIAEQDMKLRGPGDIHQMGIRQSGSLLFQFTDVLYKIEESILQTTQTITKRILLDDPNLEHEEHKNIKKNLSIGELIS